MLTLDQWKLHLMTGGAVGERPKLGQTAAENILRHVLKFPLLMLALELANVPVFLLDNICQ